MTSLIFDGTILLPRQQIDLNDIKIKYLVNQEYL